MAFGVMSGNMQPQGHAQMVMPKAVEQFNLQACSDAPRWRIDNAAALILEPTVALEIVAGLQAMGRFRTILGLTQACRRVSQRLLTERL